MEDITMSKVIAVVNNKGGVGKTTLTINLAATLVQEGKKVAMLDFDPQCSLTIGAGYKLDELTYTITDVLNAVVNGRMETIENTWLKHEEGMHLMPADKNLVGFESSLLQEYGRELFLKRYVDTIKDQFDYIIIDTQGAVSVLLINVLLASDSILIPMQAEFHSVGALDMLLGTMDQLKRNIADARFKIEGFIPQMVDIRTKDSRIHLDFIKEHYHEKYRIFDYIPFTVRLKEIAHMGGSVFRLEPEGKAAAAYKTLGREVLNFEQPREKNTIGQSVGEPVKRIKRKRRVPVNQAGLGNGVG
jgi:chromosome partitioning protein